MATRKTFDTVFQLDAQLSARYSKTFAGAEKEIAQLQKAIQVLNKSQGDISSYNKLQAALEKERTTLARLKQEHDTIQAELKESGNESVSLQNKLLAKEQQIDRTQQKLGEYNIRLEQTSKALRDAGVDTNNLAQESARLAQETDELKDRQMEVAEAAESSAARQAQAASEVSQAIAAVGITKMLSEAVELYSEFVRESAAYESAMTGVAKTTDLTDKELADLGQDYKELSTYMPVAVNDLASIGEVAGQLGVAKNNLASFTETMAMLSTATTMSADEGATMLAQFANITNMDTRYYSNLGAATVDLGNNFATTEQRILGMAQGMAAAGSIADMTEADILGIAAAVSSLGIEEQAGSSAMARIISDMQLAVETGEGLEDYARVAGMEAREFAHAWGDGAAGALSAFIRGLSDTERLGQSTSATLADLGITEVRLRRTMMSLANSGDLMDRALSTSNTAWDENIALVAEAEKRYATTESRMIMMQNAATNLEVEIGDVFNPTLGKAYERITDILVSATEFVKENPAVVKSFTAVVGVIGGATAALTAYTVAAKIAAAVSTAVPGAGVIMGITAAVAGLAGAAVWLSEATKTEADEVRDLTEASREQYFQLQELNTEYNNAVETYGETSDEARYLAWQIEELDAAFENDKQTLTEYIEECENVNSALNEMLDANREAYEEIDEDEGRILALVHRLQELTSQTDKTVETQEEMKAIIDELNEVVPTLDLNYDDVANGVTDVGAAIESAVRAEALTRRYAAAREGMVDALNAQYEAESQLQALQEQRAAAQTRYDRAYRKYERELAGVGAGGTPAWSSSAYAEWNAAQDAIESYDAEIAKTQNTLAQAQSDYATYKDALVDYAETTGEAADEMSKVQYATDDVKSELEDLATEYTLLYNAAFESVIGQYDLWDEAAKVTATSASSIESNIQSQTKYWQDYNANLEALGERTAEVEGLRDMLISFADGSKDSVNAIAGLAAVTDNTKLQKIVDDWKKLQDEQTKVAENLAGIGTDIDEWSKETAEVYGATVDGFDMSTEAEENARATIQGLIDGATDMLPAVALAYSRIGRAGLAALTTNTSVMARDGQEMMAYAEGTRSAASGWALVGEYGPELMRMSGGETVIPADLTAQLAGYGVSVAPVGASPAPSNEGTSIVYSPVYNIDGATNADELREMLEEHDEQLIERLQNMNIDVARRSYL